MLLSDTLMHPHVALLVYPCVITDSLDQELGFHHAFQFFGWQIISLFDIDLMSTNTSLFFYEREKKLNVSPGFNKVLILLFIVPNPVLYRYFHNFILMERE